MNSLYMQVAQCFCTSVVVGKDLISRLSFHNTKRLVDEMVTALARYGGQDAWCNCCLRSTWEGGKVLLLWLETTYDSQHRP